MQRYSFNPALLVILLSLAAARADITATWNGTSGNWSDSARWSGGVVPNNAAPNLYDAVINAGSVTLNQNIAINQLALGGGTLTGASALSLAEGVQWSGGIIALTGTGSITLPGGSASTVTGAPTFSSGTLFGGGGATFAVQSGATFTVFDGVNFFAQISSPAYSMTNAGTFIAQNAAGTGFTTIDAAFNTTGALRVQNTGTSHVLSLAGGGALAGTLHLDAGTLLELGGTFTIAAGTVFTGTGTVVVAGTATTLGGAGVSVPNLSVAVGQLRLAGNTLTVAGSASIEDNGALALEIRGTGALVDKLAVNGTFGAFGTLAITLGPGFTPAIGDVFDVLDFSSANGTFSAVQLPSLPSGRFWRTETLYTEGRLVIGSVPATFAQWQSAYGAGGFAADDDHDGIANGLEYVLGTQPGSGAASNGAIAMPRASIAANRLRLHFEMPDPGATDSVLTVQASDDSGISSPWTTIATKSGGAAWSGPATVTITSASPGRVAVTVEDTKLVSATPKRFLRLTAALP